MLTFTKESGFYYESETTGKHYTLHEMTPYKGKTTSDIIAIFGDDADGVIGWFYGASTIGIEELYKVVGSYVLEYESKRADQNRKPAPIAYKLTKDGVRLFVDDIDGDVCAEMDKGSADYSKFDTTITIGHRSITIPIFPEFLETLSEWLNWAEREWNE